MAVGSAYLLERLRDRVMVLDGAMGTMLQRKGLSGNSEEFNITQPEAILDIHRAREFALAGARLARQAAGKNVFVAGSMGPTSKSLTLSADLARPA